MTSLFHDTVSSLLFHLTSIHVINRCLHSTQRKAYGLEQCANVQENDSAENDSSTARRLDRRPPEKLSYSLVAGSLCAETSSSHHTQSQGNVESKAEYPRLRPLISFCIRLSSRSELYHHIFSPGYLLKSFIPIMSQFSQNHLHNLPPVYLSRTSHSSTTCSTASSSLLS